MTRRLFSVPPEVHYRMVAEVWREALEERDSPVKAIESTWGVCHSTAAAWARRARQRGLIEHFYKRYVDDGT